MPKVINVWNEIAHTLHDQTMDYCCQPEIHVPATAAQCCTQHKHIYIYIYTHTAFVQSTHQVLRWESHPTGFPTVKHFVIACVRVVAVTNQTVSDHCIKLTQYAQQAFCKLFTEPKCCAQLYTFSCQMVSRQIMYSNSISQPMTIKSGDNKSEEIITST